MLLHLFFMQIVSDERYEGGVGTRIFTVRRYEGDACDGM
jgi:hypothetical protein